MPNIPGLPFFQLPSADPLPPYMWNLRNIYKYLLKYKWQVISCKPVMYNGEHVLGMYDIRITPAMVNRGIYNIRLSPTKAKDWNRKG